MFELIVHLNPSQQGAFLGHHMTKESESVKCKPQVVQMASLTKKSVSYKLQWYPSPNLWNPKFKRLVSQKFAEASRLNSLFCLCLIRKLSKSMAQPRCCCRLTRAEINGIVASGCAWRPPSLHEIILIPCIHLMSISTSCSSHVSFERSDSTWTRCQTQCNLWKRRKMPLSYKFSEVSRLNSLFCLCLISKLSKSMAQPRCLLQADTGWDKWHCG